MTNTPLEALAAAPTAAASPDEDLIYLGSPYNHPDANVRYQRYEAAMEACSVLMKRGEVVYSPISHNHGIAYIFGLPTGWAYWKKFDSTILVRCTKLYVLMLDGWRESEGLAGELEIARDLGLPIYYLEPETWNLM